jgi:gliding motility-associated-like protein
MKRHLLVLAALIFWFGSLTAQSNFINQDSVFARTSDCALGVSVCIDSIAYDNINDLRFFLDGQQFSAQFTPCLVNTVHNYSYSDIFRGLEAGPWRLDSWTVNGRTYTGRFNNLQTLLDSMRRWNPTGNWQLENSARIIFGYVASSTTYSCQEIYGTQKGGQSQVCYNSGIEYRGLRFNVPVGVHKLIVEKVRTGERDTVTLLAACLKPETIRRTVAVGSNATYCASQADLLGTLVSTRNYCTRPANAITFTGPQATCFTYRGNVVGVDSACLQVCDRYGFCDTTYLIVNAVQPSGNSLTFSDTISVGFGRTTCEVALPTGRITTFTNICPQNSGTNVNFELDPGTSCVTYRGLVVGTNTACIRACNESGVCDTTSITIQAIPYVAPRPTTRFVYNDTLTVGLNRTKCSFNAPIGAIATFENICASASGSKVSFTLDQATKCVSYRGVAVGVDSACIRICNAAGQCDTTVMYVTGVRNNGGSGSGGRTITVRDTISVGGSRENCGVSIPSTAITIVNNCPNSSGTNVAFSLDQARRCVTYRGLTVGQDTACYVACNSNGICDTTIYIVGTVAAPSNVGRTITIRDTISVGLTRRNCGLSIPSGTYGGLSNLCPSSSGSNVTFFFSDALRCVEYTGILIGSDTACMKVCNSNGICDTTIYIITAVENTTNGGGNRCGLRVSPFVQVRSCGIKGFINLAVSGSTAPYSFRWADLTGSNQPQNRTELEAGNYTVTVSSANACDTTLTIAVANNAINCGGGGGGSNRCGLTVVPTAVNKTCASNGSITLAVSGSTAPYSFNWADLTGTNDPQNRSNLEAGIYSVTVTPSIANCDTIIAVVIANNATNCGGGGTGNRCGLVVVPTVVPKTCAGNGSVNLTVSGSTAPYTFDWADLTGTNDPQNRSTLEAGTYTVKVTPSVANCDTSISIVVANNASNCGGTGSNIRQANVTLLTGDSTTFCVDSSRVTGGFTVAFSSPQRFSVISEGTPKGCFKIKGFVVGSDVAVIILTGQNGVKDTTQLTINVTPRIIVGNGCGLLVNSTVIPKTCAANGSIALAVSGSTAPYTFDWSDVAGTSDAQNRSDLQAGTYTVKVSSSAANCDTTLTFTVLNNCVVSRCGLVVTPTATPKTCAGNGSITLAVSGSTAPYTFDWTDLTGTTDPQNRPNLEMGIYTVKVSSAVAGCDTTLTIAVANNATNCGGGGGSNIRLATVTVIEGDSTTYCVDSSRVTGGFTVQLTGVSQTYSIINQTTPVGCFKIKGFIAGRDSVTIILVGQNGVRDTTKLTTIVTPRTTGGGGSNIRLATVTVKAGDSTTYCVDSSRVLGGFTVQLSGISQNFSTLTQTTPVGCFKVKGFVAGRDSVTIILIGQNGVRDTTKLTTIVTPRDTIVTNRCGLVVRPTVSPKTCTADGSISLAVSGSTAPYAFDWTDIVGTVDSQNRRGLAAGTYTVKVTPSVSGCDTTLSVIVLNNATNCNGGTIRYDNVTVVAGDSTIYCADTSRVGAGFTIDLGGSQIYSTTTQTGVRGCFKIKGFLAGNDSMRIVLVSTAGVRDTLILRIKVTPPPSCGLVVIPTVIPRNCTVNGSINLAVSGSTAPYTFDWADIVGTRDTQNRVNLTAGIYTVKVKSAASNCDTTLLITVADNCVPNRCGLIVSPTATPKTCTSNGTITLAVTGSTGPYTFDWTDITGTVDSQNRTGLAAGLYTVKVTPSVSGCDTTLTIRVGNDASNCGGNICGLVVTPTAVPKQCTIRGSITLNVSGGTAPYSYKWADLRDSFPKNRTNLEAGIYSVSVTSATAGCDTTLRITVANDSTGCGSRTFHKDSVTVFVQDSTTYCADSSRVGTGFLVNLFSTTTPVYSVIGQSAPAGCFKIKGFVAGRDTVFIILIGQNGTRDTTQLFIKVVPRVINPTGGRRSDTITIKTLEIKNYCPDTSRLTGSPVNLIKFCSTDPFNNTSIRLDTTRKCVAVKGLTTGVDTFCIAVCNAAGFCDTTNLFVKVTPDTVTPVLRIDTVRVFVGDMFTYCNIDTGQIRGNVDTIYNICPASSGTNATTSLTADKCLKISGLVEGIDTACIVVCNRLARLCDTTRVIIIVSKRPSNVLIAREDSISIQVGEVRNYCPDTSRLRGGRVTSISFCSTATFDNAVILLVDSTKCARITGFAVGQDTACLVVCTSTGLCDTVKLKVKVVPERPLKDTTIIIPIKLGKDSLFCGIDTTQLRGLPDTIYDACPGKNGSHARMVIDRVTHCVRITGVRIGRDTMCVVVCNTRLTPRICDTTKLIVVVSDSITSNIVVIANDDTATVRRGTNRTLEVYNNDTIRPRRATSLKIVRPPLKGRADTISFRDGLIKYTATRAPSACGLDSFTYRVCLDSICDTALVVITILCPDSLRAYNAISPNGDGRNDVFLIDGLQKYPDHTVCIFNRWGNQVLNTKNYQNDWSGTWNGVNVPDGTYFYFVRNDKDGEMILTGYLQVLR